MHAFRSRFRAGKSKDPLIALLLFILLASPRIFRSCGSTISNSDLLVGHPAPDFSLKDLDGQEIQLSSFRGKIVILDFWASWCGPCRAEIPIIEHIWKQFGKKNVIVIGVNSEESAEVVRNFATKNKLTYPIVLTMDNPAVIQSYRAQALPTVAVIDKDGIIAAYRVGESSRTEEILLDDIHHVSSTKYVAPRPKAVQVAQVPAAAPSSSTVSRTVGPDPNWQPKTADELLARGSLRLRLHMIPQAKSDAEDALKLGSDSPMALFLRGRAFYEEKSYAAAIADFDEVIRRMPDWPEGYHYRGLAYSYSGQHQRALPDYQKLIELRPHLASAYNDLGWAYSELGEFDKAKTNLDKAIELEPDYIRARENRAMLFSKQHDRAGELNELTVILGVRPNDQWAKDTKDALLQNRQSPSGAQKQALAEVVRPDVPPRMISKTEPSYSEEARRAGVNAVILCSLVVNSQGVPEDVRIVRGAGFGLDENAIEAVSKWRFEPAMRQGAPVADTARVEVNFRISEPEHENQIASLNFTQQPGSTRPELVRGRIPGNRKNSDNSKVRVAFSVEVDGKIQNPSIVETNSAEWAEDVVRETKNWRFRAATANGRPVPAQAILELNHTVNGRAPLAPAPGSSATAGPDPNWQPTTADEFLARGYARLRINKYPQSRADAEDALKLVPGSCIAQFLHGRAAYEEKDYSTAVEDFTNSIGQRPDWPDAYRFRGLAYSYSGQHQQALPDYRKAIELDPYLAPAYAALGWAYIQLEQFGPAKTNLEKAIELQPDLMAARENRAKLFAKTGDVGAEQQDLTVLLGLFPNHQWAKDTQEALLQKQRSEQSFDSSQPAESHLPAPKLISPLNEAVFDVFPRRTRFEWESVPGAASYILEWDYSDRGVWAGEAHKATGGFSVQGTSFSFDFVGAQPGRWRVWGVTATGEPGTPSEWRTFRYLR